MGYAIIPNRIHMPNNIRDHFQKLADKKAKAIFNHNEKSMVNDRKRVQVSINRKIKYIDDFMKDIDETLLNIFPHLTINDWVVIKSKPGCKRQAAHTDYLPSVDMMDETKIPINVMVALQDETYIVVWPKSHRLICLDLCDEFGVDGWNKNIGIDGWNNIGIDGWNNIGIDGWNNIGIDGWNNEFGVDGDKKSVRSPISMKRIEMNKGDLFLFRGDLVHAGSEYDKSNIRLHCFMDRDYRKPNRTWLIHTHSSENMRRLIC